MRRELLIPVGIGLAIVVCLAVGILWLNRGAHLELDASIQKVRTVALDPATAVVVDFRVHNPADYPFQVRKVDVILETAGKRVEGVVVADVDAKRLFEYYPAIGTKYNDTLLMKDRIQPGHTIDRMAAARFELTEDQVMARTNLIVRIEEVDGVVTEIAEKE